MNTEQLLKEIGQTAYPQEVDVVEAVMSEVRKRPYLMPKRSRVVARRIALSAAAVVAAAVIAVPALMPKSYDEEQIGDMIASVQNYDYYSHVESVAESPLGYLYDEMDYSDNQ